MSEEIQEQILNEAISRAMDMISSIQSMLEDRIKTLELKIEEIISDLSLSDDD